MSDTPAVQFLPEYADCIAQAANHWAWVELEVHWMLWSLMEIHPTVGACLTSQIYTFPAKLDALLALMKLRSVPETTIKKVNKFAERSRPALEARRDQAVAVPGRRRREPEGLRELRNRVHAGQPRDRGRDGHRRRRDGAALRPDRDDPERRLLRSRHRPHHHHAALGGLADHERHRLAVESSGEFHSEHLGEVVQIPPRCHLDPTDLR